MQASTGRRWLERLLMAFAIVPTAIAVTFASYVCTSRSIMGYWPVMRSSRKASQLGLPVFHQVVGIALAVGALALIAYPFVLVAWAKASNRTRVVTQGIFAAGWATLLVLLFYYWSWYF